MRLHEFDVVLSYMSTHKTQISWEKEIAVLVAARFKLKLDDVELKQVAEHTMMCISYLVDSVPSLYFPSSFNGSIDDELTIMIRAMWENMRLCNLGFYKPDNESVIGLYFECQALHVICAEQFSLQVKKVYESSTHSEITLNLVAAVQRLESTDSDLLQNNILFKTPKSFKAIDFLAKVQTNLPGEGPVVMYYLPFKSPLRHPT